MVELAALRRARVKRWFIAVFCFVLSVLSGFAYGDLHVLLGPSVVADVQNEIVVRPWV
jgi:hypothetical protein